MAKETPKVVKTGWAALYSCNSLAPVGGGPVKFKDNLQLWFRDEVKRMNLNEEEMSQYSSIIVYYVAKIARLDDKDKDYSEERFKKELNSLLAKQDIELEDLLTPEQFDIHKEIYGEFLRSAYRRWGIKND